uniref:Adipose-secreted signaling protein n=1 Tax=Bubo bubo TaxID=30461 RepID=A0A8C0FUY3_BUBBB
PAATKGGGVRFAPNQPAEGAHGHVRFDEKLHDSAVMVTQEKDGSFLVKVRGVPLAVPPLPSPPFRLPQPSVPLAPSIRSQPVAALRVSLSPGYSVKCEYTAHREGVLKEEMVLASELSQGAGVKVVVQARVMGKGPPVAQGPRALPGFS